MSKFIIFAHARSGSTSLARVLSESPDVKMSIEPFNPDYIKWNPKAKDYIKIAKDTKTLNFVLTELFSEFNAMKVLDYQLPKRLYFSLLKNKDYKVIFLRRKNLLEASISNAVAHQTNKWHMNEYSSEPVDLKPLNIKEIKKWIDYVGGLVDSYQKYLEKNRQGKFLLLYYEDLYSQDFDKNKQTLKNICEFLEIELPNDNAIVKYMKPENAKINYKNMYKNIPNYDKVISLLSKKYA